MDIGERLLDMTEVAAALRISVWSAYRLVKSGKLPHVQMGPRAKLRVRVADIQRYLNQVQVGR